MVAPFPTLRFESSVNFGLVAVRLTLLQAPFVQDRVTFAFLVTPVTFSELTRPRFQRRTASPSTIGGGPSAILTCTGPPAALFLLSVPPTCTANHWPGETRPEPDCVKPALSSKQVPGRSGAGFFDGSLNGITRTTSSKAWDDAVMSITPYWFAWNADQIVLP